MNLPSTVFLLSTALFGAICVGCGDSVPSAYYRQQAAAHGIPADHVFDRRAENPHKSCDFLATPIGEKPCKFIIKTTVEYENYYDGHWHYLFNYVDGYKPPNSADPVWYDVCDNVTDDNEQRIVPIPAGNDSLKSPAARADRRWCRVAMPCPTNVYIAWEKISEP